MSCIQKWYAKEPIRRTASLKLCSILKRKPYRPMISIALKEMSVHINRHEHRVGCVTATKRTSRPSGRHSKSQVRYSMVTSCSPYTGLGADCLSLGSLSNDLSLTLAPCAVAPAMSE